MIQPIEFWVAGVPKAAGSKRSFVPLNKQTGQPFRSKATGRIVVNTVDDNPKSKDWKADVRHSITYEGPALRGALRLDLTFFMPRPQKHFHTSKSRMGQLRDDAPKYHTTKPDATKLTRGVEDAITSIIWADDAQISVQTIRKLYDDGRGPGCLVRITEAIA